MLTGYLEGWAEYAAGLCDEIGHVHRSAGPVRADNIRALLAVRMVVDTGLNALGWPLDRAAACLPESGHAVDDPSQALGYHAGHRYLRELRGTRDTYASSTTRCNDPDCLIVGPQVERREQWAAHIAGYGGLLCVSDRLSSLDAWGLEVTRRLLAEAARHPRQTAQPEGK